MGAPTDAPTEPPTTQAPCIDCNPLCAGFKERKPERFARRCQTSRRIRRNCRLSCDLCDVVPCRDCKKKCRKIASFKPDFFQRLCQNSSRFNQACQKSCGRCPN